MISERPASAACVSPIKLPPMLSPRTPPLSPARIVENVLKPDEARGVETYTSTLAYRGINETLRKPDAPLAPEIVIPPSLPETIEHIDSALDKLTHAQGRRFLHTYRGVGDVHANHLATLERNDVFRDPAFVSTTRATERDCIRQTLNRLARNGALIHVYGHSSADVTKPVTAENGETFPLSVHPCMEEQIYPRNTAFRTLLNVPADRADRERALRESRALRAERHEQRLATMPAAEKKAYRRNMLWQQQHCSAQKAPEAKVILVLAEARKFSEADRRRWQAQDQRILDRLGLDRPRLKTA